MFRSRISIITVFALILILSAALSVPALSQTKRESVVLDGSLHRNFKIDKDGSFSVDNHNGRVEVESWNKNEVDIEINERFARDDYEIEIEFIVSNDRVRVKAYFPDNYRWNNWFGNNRRPEAEFTIRVPKTVEVGVETHNGSVRVSEISNNVNINSHNGSINLSVIKGRTDVEAHNGDIDVRQVDGDLSIDTHNGDIDVEDLKGNLSLTTHNGVVTIRGAESEDMRVESYNGRISCDFTPASTGSFDFTTHNGRLDVRIPEDSKLNVRVRCRSRNFDTDFEELEDLERDESRRSSRNRRYRNERDLRLNGEINGGGGRLTLTAGNGSVRLRSK